METELGRGKRTKITYGLDEIALAPSIITVNPDDMDGVVSPKTAALMSKYGGLGVLNLQGVWAKYENADEVLEQIASASKDGYIELMQKIYLEPSKPKLVEKRIKEIKDAGAKAAVSSTPAEAMELGPIAAKAGADIFFIQATVFSTKHKSTGSKMLVLSEFIEAMKIPVVVGNCATYDVALDLMKNGASAVLVGIGPGAACTSRGVLGIGVPMATSISDCAAARETHFKETGKYVPIIGDGGMVVGGDICKAIACGADAVMIGSPLAKAEEAPGRGFHWGMAAPSPVLPRGTRIKVGTIGSLKEILIGPAKYDDGSMNFAGALKTSMGTLGASNLKEMQHVEVVIAPSILTEGKVYQKAQQLGMYK